MRLTGILRTWHDDRGFGFIAPTQGGAELFVHISELPGDGTRPTPGETLSYELGRGKNGQVQAVKVIRQAIGPMQVRSRTARPVAAKRGAPRVKLIGLALVLALGGYGYQQYARVSSRPSAPPQALMEVPAANPAPLADVSGFRCDGRIHCSQMSSCKEAKFFLKNCPGTQMDGDYDGVPCEQQLCTGLLGQ